MRGLGTKDGGEGMEGGEMWEGTGDQEAWIEDQEMVESGGW